MIPKTVPECLSCGACCFGGHDRYIRLFPEDLARGLPDHALHWDGAEVFMAMTGGHCAQLTLTDAGTLACAVYDSRPTACRAFRAGSFECAMARRHRGAEAQRMTSGPAPLPDDLPAAGVIDAMSPGRRRVPGDRA
ncbi:YkgJ family cysteine cluster protein [Pseudooceanicola pacificus]|uniref:YkgJ family cysteine cluster protein n=1 Tax=Pseudooceanicola pacificus TaxID=2676438 RepID=UPI001365F427|nr:YkgJ family cysteine cluster protein [Pseudooceanicola pacificus]